jgi:hypothetical protein
MVPDFPDPIIVRHSELADFRHCPLKHKLGWVEGWHDPEREARGARSLGTSWHAVLQARYEELQRCAATGEQPDEEHINDMVFDVLTGVPEEEKETLWWMYDGYVETYGLDSEWEILAVEQTMRVPFHDEDDQPLLIDDPRTDTVRPVLYEWTSDILVRWRAMRGVFVVDNKSTSQPLGQTDIDLSDQFGLYTVAWQRRGTKVRGQVVNQTKTKQLKRPMALDERNVRGMSIRTPTELRNIELDAVATIRAMYSVANIDRPYSAPDPRSCGWKCDFKEAHLQMRRMKDPKKIDGMFHARGFERGATHGARPLS